MQTLPGFLSSAWCVQALLQLLQLFVVFCARPPLTRVRVNVCWYLQQRSVFYWAVVKPQWIIGYKNYTTSRCDSNKLWPTKVHSNPPRGQTNKTTAAIIHETFTAPKPQISSVYRFRKWVLQIFCQNNIWLSLKYVPNQHFYVPTNEKWLLNLTWKQLPVRIYLCWHHSLQLHT